MCRKKMVATTASGPPRQMERARSIGSGTIVGSAAGMAAPTGSPAERTSSRPAGRAAASDKSWE